MVVYKAKIMILILTVMINDHKQQMYVYVYTAWSRNFNAHAQVSPAEIVGRPIQICFLHPSISVWKVCELQCKLFHGVPKRISFVIKTIFTTALFFCEPSIEPISEKITFFFVYIENKLPSYYKYRWYFLESAQY